MFASIIRVLVICLCIQPILAQSYPAVCGDSADERYHDFNPDITFSLYSSGPPYFDIDNDGLADFVFNVNSYNGLPPSYKTVINLYFTVLNNKIESAWYAFDSIPWQLKAIKGFAEGDTIQATGTDFIWKKLIDTTLIFTGFSAGYGQGGVGGNWYPDTAKYYGYRYIDEGDTAYGWFKVYTHLFSPTEIIVLDACGIPGHTITALDTKKNIFINPNPATGNFMVAAEASGEIVICNMLGEIIYEDPFSDICWIDLPAGLRNGIYIVYVIGHDEDTDYVYAGKLVLAR